jgi:hypothetical protein
VWRAIDLALRFIYVALIPPILAVMNAIIPVGGIVISAAIATVIAMLGAERWHARVDRIPVVGRALGGMGRLGEFYKEHPPKPLVYYIFYPILLPVILFMRVPRREFLLYRKISLLAFVVMLASGIAEYFRHWYPVIPFRLFFAEAIAIFLLQLLTTFAIVMPIVTTILMYHQRGYTKRVAALVVCASLTGGFGMFILHRTYTVPAAVAARVQARTHNAPRLAFGAFENGLNAAWLSLRDHPDDHDAALTAARDALQPFYLADEAAAFQLWIGSGVIALYVKPNRHEALWVGRDAKALIKDDFRFDLLPHDAYKPLGIRR